MHVKENSFPIICLLSGQYSWATRLTVPIIFLTIMFNTLSVGCCCLVDFKYEPEENLSVSGVLVLTQTGNSHQKHQLPPTFVTALMEYFIF